jgi:hypothetical protein
MTDLAGSAPERNTPVLEGKPRKTFVWGSNSPGMWKPSAEGESDMGNGGVGMGDGKASAVARGVEGWSEPSQERMGE